MTKIIELAHMLGLEIAASSEMKKLAEAKDAFESNADLQNKMSEYETDRVLLTQEYSKEAADEKLIADLHARIDELAAEITSDSLYVAFTQAQAEVNALMNEVNEEIKFCITGERPSDCTHDCSTCKGCH
jgi:cell fate (sporulation/competence/biofilm development) regulator YlbF (YheA/YmcA/DUF963 family)